MKVALINPTGLSKFPIEIRHARYVHGSQWRSVWVRLCVLTWASIAEFGSAVSSMRSATSRSGSTLVGESIRHPPGMRPSPQVVAAVALAAANAQVGAVPLPPFSYTDMSPIDPKQRPFPKFWPCRINPPLWRCLINQALWCRINQALRRQMSCQCRTPPVFPNVADVQFAVPRRNQI
jgi:hypothetical protein